MKQNASRFTIERSSNQSWFLIYGESCIHHLIYIILHGLLVPATLLIYES